MRERKISRLGDESAVSAVLTAWIKRNDIDPNRIGLTEVSLGGYDTPRAASFEPRVKASVGRCAEKRNADIVASSARSSRSGWNQRRLRHRHVYACTVLNLA